MTDLDTKVTEEQLRNADFTEEIFILASLYHARMKDPEEAAQGRALGPRYEPLVRKLVEKGLVVYTGEDRTKVRINSRGCNVMNRFKDIYCLITDNYTREE